MKVKFIVSAVLAMPLALSSLGSGRAAAQFPPQGPGGIPNTGPAVSPYLNILRPGNTAGANYYGLVKPQLEFRNAFRGLQQQVTGQQMAQSTDPRTGLPETGHGAMFLNTHGYFLNNSPGQGQGGGIAGRAGLGGQAKGNTAAPAGNAPRH
jgi:hypothetical protein